MIPADLAAEWRERAKEFRRFGADEQASTLEACAEDLEAWWQIHQTEPLTLDEAAEESGYSYSTLQQKVASGEIPNIGESGRPRVRRQDLPRKASGSNSDVEEGEPDLAAEILAGRL